MQAVVPRPVQLGEGSLIHFVITATGIVIPTLTGIVWLGCLIDRAAKSYSLSIPLFVQLCVALGGLLLAGNGYLYLFFKYVPL